MDTNVLVYACDRSGPEKQWRALEVLDRPVMSEAGVISTQALSEFLVAVTRKIAAPHLDCVGPDRDDHPGGCARGA